MSYESDKLLDSVLCMHLITANTHCLTWWRHNPASECARINNGHFIYWSNLVFFSSKLVCTCANIHYLIYTVVYSMYCIWKFKWSHRKMLSIIVVDNVHALISTFYLRFWSFAYIKIYRNLLFFFFFFTTLSFFLTSTILYLSLMYSTVPYLGQWKCEFLHNKAVKCLVPLECWMVGCSLLKSPL